MSQKTNTSWTWSCDVRSCDAEVTLHNKNLPKEWMQVYFAYAQSSLTGPNPPHRHRETVHCVTLCNEHRGAYRAAAGRLKDMICAGNDPAVVAKGATQALRTRATTAERELVTARAQLEAHRAAAPTRTDFPESRLRTSLLDAQRAALTGDWDVVCEHMEAASEAMHEITGDS